MKATFYVRIKTKNTNAGHSRSGIIFYDADGLIAGFVEEDTRGGCDPQKIVPGVKGSYDVLEVTPRDFNYRVTLGEKMRQAGSALDY